MPEPKSPVSLEDLLRLKRAERPAPEFWSKFEQELRQKQLTALVQKRRWWHELPILLSRRIYIPAGAAAALALTFATVRYSTAPSSPIQNLAPESVAENQSLPVEVLPVTEVAIGERSSRPESALPVPETRRAVVAGGNLATARDITDGVELVPVAAPAVESPSARSIAANLARLEQSEPELVNAVLGSRLSTSARVQTVAVAHVESGLETSRRHRLLARYADHSLSPEPAAPASVRERLARRLGDDLNDRMGRIGVEGSQVSLKF